MTTKQAIEAIYAPKGVTSVLNGIMSGDYSVFPHTGGEDSNLQKAASQVDKYQKQLDECKSDWSYWSILGDLEYWKAIKNILEAAHIVGDDNLPDIPKPNLGGQLVVMDQIYEVTKFGAAILAAAKEKEAANPH